MTKAMKVEGPLHVVCQCDKCKTESQEPVGEVDAIGLNETDFHVSFKRPMPLGTKLYTHPPQIKTTDSFESEKVADYNRGWNDCLFASGIQRTEPKVCCQQYDTCLEPCTPRGEHLAQRTWVGLTDYEIGICSTEAAMNRSGMVGGAVTFARAIEAKLKEKNFV